ncbi:hypothetical protein WK76_24890 [Burkholderia ubonensis]|nr:hypothetical protein WK76_24890 [Burkholderia ubonensis]
MRGQKAWNTEHELKFVDGLAGQADSSALLSGYLIGMMRRTVFGAIDRKVAIRHAETRLKEVRRAGRI